MPQAIDQETLRSLLHYDPETGVFRWKQDSGATRAGDEAGRVYRWPTSSYRRICINGQRCFAHRLAFLYMTGAWPVSEVDHIDGDGLNNRWHNLREATRTENQRNSRVRPINKCGLKGVSPHRGKYQATIAVNRKKIYLGLCKTPEEAHELYCAAAQRYFGTFARAT